MTSSRSLYRLIVGAALSGLTSMNALSVTLEPWLQSPKYRADANGKVLFTSPSVNIMDVATRCEQDSLSPEEARQRLQWALNCKVLPKGLIVKMMVEYNDDGEAIPISNPYYPIFLDKDSVLRLEFKALWKPNLASCAVPPNIAYATSCRSSCYTPEQMLSTAEGEQEIAQAQAERTPVIKTLDTASSSDEIVLKDSEVGSYVRSLTDTFHDIRHFYTASGNEIRVTTNHPLVRGDGMMVTADTLKVGDSLMSVDSGADEIVGIMPEEFYGKVYNVEPKSLKASSNVVVVQGFLNGSARFQNTFSNLLGRYSLRDSIPEGLVTK